jgi:DNA modification methylase
MKPVELPIKAIGNSSRDSEIIYEPFAGSGTTLIACEQLNRQCRAVEISPAYAAVILQRYKDSTNVEPVLIDTVTKQ